MVTELRRDFHDRVGLLHERVAGMAREVGRAVRLATQGLLEDDAPACDEVVGLTTALHLEYAGVEADVVDLLALQAPVGRDLRLVLSSLRVAQEWERSGDLAASVGRRARRLPATALGTDLRLVFHEIGAEATGMIDAAADAYALLDIEAAEKLAPWDARVDDLHRRLLGLVFSLDLPGAEAAVELAMVGRFYERLADHAVVVGERVRFVVSGTMDATDADERG